MGALTVHNAEIRTATVEIRTLTISGKQVTLAVFRQLIESDLISADVAFNGLPWGTVNYHPDKKCDIGRFHKHVVWQLGTELRRATQYRPHYPSAAEWIESGQDWLDAAILAGWFPKGSEPPPEEQEMQVNFPSGLASVDFDINHRLALWPYTWGRPGDEGYEARLAQCREGALAHIRGRSATTERDAHATADAEVAECWARRRQYLARWSEIQALPQLFIAV